MRRGASAPSSTPPFALPFAPFSAPAIRLPATSLPIRLGLGFLGAAAVRDALSGGLAALSGCGGGGSGCGGGGCGGSEGGIREAARAVEDTARAAALIEGEECEEEGLTIDCIVILNPASLEASFVNTSTVGVFQVCQYITKAQKAVVHIEGFIISRQRHVWY